MRPRSRTRTRDDSPPVSPTVPVSPKRSAQLARGRTDRRGVVCDRPGRPRAGKSVAAATRQPASSRRIRQVLHELPQPAVEDCRTRARRVGSDRYQRTRRGPGKDRPQASNRRDAAGWPPAAGQSARRQRRFVAGGRPRPGRVRPPQSGPAHTASSQPRRISERHPRPVRDRHRCGVAAAGRQCGVRVRQQRRRAVAVAGPDGAISGSGGENQRDGAGTCPGIPVAGHDLRADGSQPGKPLQRGSAVGIERWTGDSLRVSCRW